MKNKIIKISIVAIILLAGLGILTGCTETASASDNNRFIKISNEGYFSIYYDSKTKVQYAVSMSSYNYGNVTLLVDKDGKPLLYEE